MANTNTMALNKSLQESVAAYKQLQQDISKCYQQRVQLTQQLNENEMVKKELEMLTSNESDSSDACVVYKLVGPLLVRQDTYEAKANVGKRLEYIEKEIQRLDTSLKSLEQKQVEAQKSIQKYQQKLQATVSTRNVTDS